MEKKGKFCFDIFCVVFYNKYVKKYYGKNKNRNYNFWSKI